MTMYRNRRLLDVARQAPCCLQVPDVCRSGVDSSVPAHSNMLRHGRGSHLKSHDCYAIGACNECHFWYDFGRTADRAEKQAAFEAGLQRWWRWLVESGRVTWQPEFQKYLDTWPTVSQDQWEREWKFMWVAEMIEVAKPLPVGRAA